MGVVAPKTNKQTKKRTHTSSMRNNALRDLTWMIMTVNFFVGKVAFLLTDSKGQSKNIANFVSSAIILKNLSSFN
jgi:hypothetical protein